jgi:hypothetical protein
MTTMHVPVEGLHLGFIFLQTKGCWSANGLPLSYALRFVVDLMCSSLCLFETIIELHAMDENEFFIGN